MYSNIAITTHQQKFCSFKKILKDHFFKKLAQKRINEYGDDNVIENVESLYP